MKTTNTLLLDQPIVDENVDRHLQIDKNQDLITEMSGSFVISRTDSFQKFGSNTAHFKIRMVGEGFLEEMGRAKIVMEHIELSKATGGSTDMIEGAFFMMIYEGHTINGIYRYDSSKNYINKSRIDVNVYGGTGKFQNVFGSFSLVLASKLKEESLMELEGKLIAFHTTMDKVLSIC